MRRRGHDGAGVKAGTQAGHHDRGGERGHAVAVCKRNQHRSWVQILAYAVARDFLQGASSFVSIIPINSDCEVYQALDCCTSMFVDN